jgi:hypothetical protein
MIYYKNSPVVRSSEQFMRSEIRTLSGDEVNQLICERKVTPINEIRYNKNSSRISRPKNWVEYVR